MCCFCFKNITDGKQKLALLLNYTGDEAYDVYNNC